MSEPGGASPNRIQIWDTGSGKTDGPAALGL